MVERRDMRAGDGDREQVAEALRHHFAEGRLDPEEFDERLTTSLRARTMGELSDLLADLPPDPHLDGLPVPVAAPTPRPVRRPDRPVRAFGTPPLRGQVATYVTSCLVCVLVWVLAGGGYFWPAWVIGPWGVVLLGQAIAGRRD